MTEAPRLWYLRAREVLEHSGFAELKCARAVFTLKDPEGQLCAMLTLHLDDGMLFGDVTNQTFLEARKEIDKRFNIKQWRTLNEKTPTD